MRPLELWNHVELAPVILPGLGWPGLPCPAPIRIRPPPATGHVPFVESPCAWSSPRALQTPDPRPSPSDKLTATAQHRISESLAQTILSQMNIEDYPISRSPAIFFKKLFTMC